MKCFPDRYISWNTQIIQGGSVAIMFNRVLGPYFKTGNGLRQEDRSKKQEFSHEPSSTSMVRPSTPCPVSARFLLETVAREAPARSLDASGPHCNL